MLSISNGKVNERSRKGKRKVIGRFYLNCAKISERSNRNRKVLDWPGAEVVVALEATAEATVAKLQQH